MHTICVRFRVFIYGELLECARFLEKNVWRIIEKASLPIKSVGTKLKGTPFYVKGKRQKTAERAIKLCREKGGNVSSSLVENATSQDYSQDVSARTVSRFLNF